MPIKLPKGFQRRKSSGNALEEVTNPPDSSAPSSFRVLERPQSKGKSFDGGVSLKMAVPGNPRPPPKDAYEEGGHYAASRGDLINRGSGGTERSHSTANYDSAASSSRLSTSSTNPSSTDTRSDRYVHTHGPNNYNDMPVHPPASMKPSLIRSPVRTFSFGIIKNRASPTASPVDLPPSNPFARDRAVTTSTTSTATPPRLIDSDLALENSELDGFGNMFDHIGTSSPINERSSMRLVQDEEDQDPSSPAPGYPPTSYPGAVPIRPNAKRGHLPQPISTDRSRAVASSPYSWTSQDSRDGLMRSPSPSKTITQGSPAKIRGYHSSFQNPAPTAAPAPVPAAVTAPAPPPVPKHMPRSSTVNQIDPPPSAMLQSSHEGTSLLPRSSTTNDVGRTTPSSVNVETFDSSLVADAEVATMFQESKPVPPKQQTNKVMTPAQWERYKQQKEMDRKLGALSDDSSSEAGDDYEDDDDDEIEKAKQAAQQRRKQEAHLSVYRQTMMKVTGETAQPRPGSGLGGAVSRFGASSDDLPNRLSHLTVESKQSGRSSGEEDDEDEDVPLGILAAHGFPNKNRPPTRLVSSSSNPNLRSVSQAQAPPPPATNQPPKGNLPVFARHLPQDPYYGAGLVNPSNRESLAMHGPPGPGSVVMGSGPATGHPIHPAGLVGVIAGEERARAARRGSPNPQGNYDMPPMQHPGMIRSHTTGTLPMMNGYPPVDMHGMPLPFGPGDHAQMQISQQMTQMMQMQMQWMQQMQQMMGGQAQGMPPGFGQPPQINDPFAGGANPRAQSMMMAAGPSQQLQGQRPMSTLNNGMAPWKSTPSFVPSINVNGNYAPSIAPSERSNIGLAPRYRPVSTVPEPDSMSTRRASTFTSATTRPWLDGAKNATHSTKPSINTLGRRSPLANMSRDDDDDDEEGWAEMQKRKDKKQKGWAARKGNNGLQELYQ